MAMVEKSAVAFFASLLRFPDFSPMFF